ncbi:somatomedin-B and thrombospondin type-1 domain-containing protein isoform X2 [Acipenser ruthenus]|uniref:somatomedin-B and thrombospondin type-1 domain-containing protein isoform X2 n=1 Tax=Acipenser ruthenus TaxID=7906 RepID=UPI00274282DB|nr:somatomedin-B and thrombospondin type-1 domain-containing protein isoform X2 [Acipenser ruthenus]
MSGIAVKGGCLVLLAALLWLSNLAEGGCSGKCCKGRDPTCSSTDWRMDRVFGTCFCDGTCKHTGDCCYDYTQECPAQPCTVSEWSPWSGCALQCKPAYRVRRRSIEQEPKNGGDPCPPLEEKAGCLEYVNYQGQYCAQTHEFLQRNAHTKFHSRSVGPSTVSLSIGSGGLLLLQPWNTIKKEENEICPTNQKLLGFVWNLSWNPFPSSAPLRPGLTLSGCSIYERAIQYVYFVNHQL